MGSPNDIGIFIIAFLLIVLTISALLVIEMEIKVSLYFKFEKTMVAFYLVQAIFIFILIN